jgi:hypothetical protein
MSSKSTWLWMVLAAALFAFIFIFERYFQHPEPGPQYLLPELDARTVRTLEIQPANQLEIRVVHTNGSWQLTEPIVYPAQNTNVQKLLQTLQQLTVVHGISEQELRKDPKADENYGLEPPQISLVLRGLLTNRIYFGRRTTPGDQVFVRVIGIEGISVVDAEVLNLFPTNAAAWRETALIDFARIPFSQVTVTNAAKNAAVQFQYGSTNRQWAMTAPMLARADNEKVEAALQALDKLQVRQFLSDNPKADLDSFGLQSPELTIAFASGTNTLLTVDFGKESTNSPGLIFARRSDQKTVVAVSTNALGPWRTSYELFRDRHLVRLPAPLDKIEVEARDRFSLQWQTNNSWTVAPQGFTADTRLSAGLAQTLADLQVAEFERDTVNKSQLSTYGLMPPARKYILTWERSVDSTNPPVELDFGTNAAGKVFAKRAEEDAVYGITTNDFEKLPDASWEMRKRQIWDFGIDDVARITVRQNGLTREMIRNGTNGWSLAAGSQGIINDSAVEDTARELGHLTAFSWVGHGQQNLGAFGFTPESFQVSVQLKNGETRDIQFGGSARFDSRYAWTKLNDEPWIFEFPPDLYSAVRYCLMIPPAS